MEQIEKKTRAPRRTKAEIHTLIFAAVERLIVAKGFNNISLPEVASEAGVEPPVLYKRYKHIDELYSEYVLTKDFLLNKHIHIDQSLSIAENAVKLYHDLIDELYENEIMQRILVWELSDTCPITRHIAQKREYDNGFIGYL
ncbi:MAG: TetR family transcriptional regulator [Bacteroidales bacterium]|jgi:AcrR family transcriptional regulator|nr:TetR family transcriptional regulator [Bacteroidales bacterium]